MFENYKDVVSVDELCEMIGVGRNTAYELMNTGKIKTVRVGRRHIIPKQSIIDFLSC